jgi:hypothetical protein
MVGLSMALNPTLPINPPSKPDRCKNQPVGAAPRRDIGPGAGLLQSAMLDFTSGAFQETMQHVYFIRQITG